MPPQLRNRLSLNFADTPGTELDPQAVHPPVLEPTLPVLEPVILILQPVLEPNHQRQPTPEGWAITVPDSTQAQNSTPTSQVQHGRTRPPPRAQAVPVPLEAVQQLVRMLNRQNESDHRFTQMKVKLALLRDRSIPNRQSPHRRSPRRKTYARRHTRSPTKRHLHHRSPPRRRSYQGGVAPAPPRTKVKTRRIGHKRKVLLTTPT